KLKPQQSVKKMTANYFRDERLQMAYSLQTLYIGGDPFRAPAMYSLVPFSEHEHGVYYLKGGYGSLIPTLEKALRLRNNLTIKTNTAVQQIVTEEGKAKGIETAEGY